MKIKYKLYELVKSDLLEDRSSISGNVSRTILGEVKDSPWNDFNSPEEALVWVKERKKSYKGTDFTVVPVISVPCVEWDEDDE